MEVASTTAHLHSDGHFVTEEDQYSSMKLGMWLFLATELLLFGGLFTTYAIYRAKYPEMFFEGHEELSLFLGGLNTIILVFSSFTVAVGVTAIQRNKPRLLSWMLGITILCGLLFGLNKYIEYSHKFHEGIVPGKNIFFSLYFMMTGLHMLHVFIGVGILAFLLIFTLRGRYSSKNYTGVEVGALYWHLVDLIWIYLFPLLYLVA